MAGPHQMQGNDHVRWDSYSSSFCCCICYHSEGAVGQHREPEATTIYLLPNTNIIKGVLPASKHGKARSIYHSDMVWGGEVSRKRCNASLFCTRYSTRFLSCGTQCNAGSIKYSEEGLNLLSSVILQEAGLNLLSILSNCIVGSGLVGHLHKVTNNKGKTNEILMLLSFLNLYLKGTCSINWGI